MDDLVFSLGVTMPIFLLMLLGYGLNRVGLVSDELASLANGFVFKVALPASLFSDLCETDIVDSWDGSFVLFCAASTLLSILVCWAVSRAFGRAPWRGEFIQASYRSGAAFLGVAFVQNIYGSVGMAPLMIIGAVPVYNVSAVVILELTRPDAPGGGRVDAAMARRLARGVATNPIILGIACGCAWSLLRVPMPAVLGKVVADVGGIATPLGLIALGASFRFRKALSVGLPALVSSAIKLVGLAAVFLPVAAWLGYAGQKLVAALMMLSLPSTVSGYVMAKSMGHEGTLASSVVMLTTLLSAVTLTFWLWLLKSQGLV